MTDRQAKIREETNQAIIDLRGVVKEYEGLSGVVTALKGVDLQVLHGEFLVITGKSGSGKTTFVNVLTGLDASTSGEIWVSGTGVHRLGPEKAARWRGRSLGVVFQTFELLPTLSVLQNVTLPMDFAGKYSISERKARAMHLLEQVGIEEHAHKLPSGVSGGQQQRVAIARALANDPSILVADEPTGSLDSATSSSVLQVFEKLRGQGMTIVLVTHDVDINQFATHRITLSEGEIVYEARQ
jgi:putative ABC transport system ATP-binding protein